MNLRPNVQYRIGKLGWVGAFVVFGWIVIGTFAPVFMPASAFNPLRRLGPQVDEVLYLHEKLDKKSAKERTLQLFDAVNLTEAQRCYNSYPHELSTGMLQRAMIAMAIACHPRLIIADEPTTALDVDRKKKVLQCLYAKKCEMGMSLILISHDLGLVASYADRMAILHQGRIVEVAETRTILKRPQHSQTQKLLKAAQRFHKIPKRVDFEPEEVRPEKIMSHVSSLR